MRAGLVCHLGVSNYAAWQLQKSVDVARLRGWEPFVHLAGSPRRRAAA